jgi:uncharacterized protein
MILLTTRQDLKSAMRTRDMQSLNPLKALITAHQSSLKETMNKKPELPTSHFESDAFLAPIIHKQIAKRRDSIIGFKEYRRDDLVEREAAEIAVLERYLPQPQTTPEEVKAMTVEAIESLRSSGNGANDPGNMSHNRIFKWLKSDEGRQQKLDPIMADQTMVRTVIAETVRELSDRVDASTTIEIEKLKPKEEDTLTKDRFSS